jgi:hypothetical protein
MPRRNLALAALASLASLACAPLASGADLLPDDLGSVVLQQTELSSVLLPDAELVDRDGTMRLVAVIYDSLNGGPTYATAEKIGLVAGHKALFFGEGAPTAGRATSVDVTAGTSAMLFTSPEAARAYASEQVQNGTALVGGKLNSGETLIDFQTIPLEAIGDQAVEYTFHTRQSDDRNAPVKRQTIVRMVRGRLLLSAYIQRNDESVATEDLVLAIAKTLDARAVALAEQGAPRRASPDGRGPGEPDLGRLSLRLGDVAPNAYPSYSYRYERRPWPNGNGPARPVTNVAFTLSPTKSYRLGGPELLVSERISREESVKTARSLAGWMRRLWVVPPSKATQDGWPVIAKSSFSIAGADVTVSVRRQPKFSEIRDGSLVTRANSASQGTILVRSGTDVALVTVRSVPSNADGQVNFGPLKRLARTTAQRMVHPGP